MIDYLAHVTDGSGLELNDRYYRVKAHDARTALRRIVVLDHFADPGDDVLLERVDTDATSTLWCIDTDGLVVRLIDLDKMPAAHAP